jgi:hypothetical protein
VGMTGSEKGGARDREAIVFGARRSDRRSRMRM